MRRRLLIKKRLRKQSRMLRAIAKQQADARESCTHNFYLTSAGPTNPFVS